MKHLYSLPCTAANEISGQNELCLYTPIQIYPLIQLLDMKAKPEFSLKVNRKYKQNIKHRRINT